MVSQPLTQLVLSVVILSGSLFRHNSCALFSLTKFSVKLVQHRGIKYFSFPRYRKVVLNNCTKGVKELYTPRKQQCPNRPPKGLLLTTKDGKLTASLGSNVTFMVHLDEVRTNTSTFSYRPVNFNANLFTSVFA